MKDRTGKRQGRLTAVEPLRSVAHRWWWLYRCTCGAVIALPGNTRRTSCGSVLCRRPRTPLAKWQWNREVEQKKFGN